MKKVGVKTKLCINFGMKIAPWQLFCGVSLVPPRCYVCQPASLRLVGSAALCMCQTGAPPAPVWKMISWGTMGFAREPEPISNKHLGVRPLM